MGSTPDQENYGYDTNGNVDTNGSVVSAPNSNTGDNQISSDGNYNYYYANNGNLIQQVQCSGNTNTAEPYEIDYTYDFRNRLIQVTDTNQYGQVTQVIQYGYDAFNNLVARTQITYTYANNSSTTPATTTTLTGHFVFDGQNMVLTLDNSGNVTERVLWGPAVDQILAEEGTTGLVTWCLGTTRTRSATWLPTTGQ